MTRPLRSTLRVLATGVAATYLLMHPGVMPVQAAQLSTQEITQFLANPSSLLSSNPEGGARLVSTVRDLVLTDANTLSALVNLIPGANPSQQSSMGAGLGQAAQALVRTNPTLAAQIQQQLVACGDACRPALSAFAAVTGNVQIGAVGGGGGAGGGGGGGVGGPVNGGPPTGAGGGGSGVGGGGGGGVSTAGNVFSAGGGGRGVGGGGGGGTTGSVSPR